MIAWGTGLPESVDLLDYLARSEAPDIVNETGTASRMNGRLQLLFRGRKFRVGMHNAVNQSLKLVAQKSY